MDNTYYPPIFERFKAILVDAFIVVSYIVGVGLIVAEIPAAPGWLRGVLLLIAFLYEPVMVSTGGTIGHRLFGLRVRSIKETSKNIIFPLSLVRTLVKITLGWISFLSMRNRNRQRALHDIMSLSIVLFHEQESAAD